MNRIEGGFYTPFYGGDTIKEKIADFMMDVYPVTNAEFITFLKSNPKWQKSKVIQLFADENYLSQFKGDLKLASEHQLNAPVTNVSWYAAKSYCACQGKRLPSMAEWEYVASASKTKKDARKDEAFTQYILTWYEKRYKYTQVIGSTFKNYWGIWDMHGLVWEWVEDFNSILISTDSRGGGKGINNQFVCGGASVNANNPSNYAAFMRYAFRSSLKAKYNIKNLGFRCVKNIN